VVVEGGTDAEHDARVEKRKVAVDKFFLTRCADTDPDEIGLKVTDGGDELVFLVAVEVAVRRSPGADDLGPGKPAPQVSGEGFGDAWIAAIEKMRIAREATIAEDFEHEVGTGDAFHAVAALETADPDGGHAIGNGDGGVGVDGGEARVAVGFHDAVDADDGDVAFFVAAQNGSDALQGAGHVEGFHANAEDAGMGGQRRFHGRHRMMTAKGETVAEIGDEIRIEKQQQREIKEKSDGRVDKAREGDAEDAVVVDEPRHGTEHGGAGGEVEEGHDADAIEGHQGVIGGDAEGEGGGAPRDEGKDGPGGLRDGRAGEETQPRVAEEEQERRAGGDEENIRQESANQSGAELLRRRSLTPRGEMGKEEVES